MLKLQNEYHKKFLFAGKALFTLHNQKTNNHFTYKVIKCKNTQNLFFVQAFTGTDNDSHYKYIGILTIDKFQYGKKSKISQDAQVVKVFDWFVKNINILPDFVQMLHSNKCGRCGRTLTHPESITTGIGPECIKHVNRG